MKYLQILLIIFTFLISSPTWAEQPYNHDRWGTSSKCIVKDFKAYRSCFDDVDDDDGNKSSDIWGVPQWVSYEMRRFDGSCINTAKDRPSWKTDSKLFAQGIMPGDKSYAYPQSFKAGKEDWFSRGHLAMKMHTERLGQDAGIESFMFYNSVPQRQRFNAGIWQDLEDLTSIWAQEYGAVWIIAGPIFADKYTFAHIGETGELPVAVPDALFKIVIRESTDPQKPYVLAFIYPQVGPGYYRKGGFDHTRFLTTVDEIEELTSLDFLMNLSKKQQEIIETTQAPSIWPYKKEDFVRACSETKYND